MAKIIYGVSDIDTMMAGKQDELTAGTGISIVNNVISATGSGGITGHTYTTFMEFAADVIANPGGYVILKNTDLNAIVCGVRAFEEDMVTYLDITPTGYVKDTTSYSVNPSMIMVVFSLRATSEDANPSQISTTLKQISININTGETTYGTQATSFGCADFTYYY